MKGSSSLCEVVSFHCDWLIVKHQPSSACPVSQESFIGGCRGSLHEGRDEILGQGKPHREPRGRHEEGEEEERHARVDLEKFFEVKADRQMISRNEW